MRTPLLVLAATLAALSVVSMAAAAAPARPRNIVFILTDDHRFDALGFAGHPFLETPHFDSLARNGAHLARAFVTTALCSPSRASILTGLYEHHHGVVDNNNPVRSDLVFFPQLLQRAGYRTGFFGKWQMGGDSAAPQRGFDKWVSFRGQGEYWPDRRGTPNANAKLPASEINVDGITVPQKGYITDELTDYALTWMREQPKEQPFFLFLSHKAVHAHFVPAARHAGRYKDKPLPKPTSRTLHENAPMWVRNQRNSWHGIDFPYHSSLDVEHYYQRYCETLLAVDDSVGRVVGELRARGQLEDTLIVYMGDNGFGFGEHGLIDKRTAYEWSMRVPLIFHFPAAIPARKTIGQVVANIDLAPTLLAAAGVAVPAGLDGRSYWPLARGEAVPWREEFLYEYYWERNYPQTPTLHALRTDRYKYIHVHGLWDIDELYDLKNDPGETCNLIFSPEHATIVRDMNQRLFAALRETGGMTLPLQPDRGEPSNLRNAAGPGRRLSAKIDSAGASAPLNRTASQFRPCRILTRAVSRAAESSPVSAMSRFFRRCNLPCLAFVFFRFVTGGLSAQEAPKPALAPAATPVEVAPLALPGAEAHVFRATPQGELRLHVFKPEGWRASDKRAAFVWFFGGGWTKGTPSPGWAKVSATWGMVGIAPDYCTEHGIELTRSRPWRKNDR